MRDPLVVRTEELAAVLRPYIDKHNGRHPSYIGGSISLSDQSIAHRSFSAFNYIILNSSVTINERTVRRILSGESKHTQLFIADSILCAIEEQGALTDGRIEVLPNPQNKFVE